MKSLTSRIVLFCFALHIAQFLFPAIIPYQVFVPLYLFHTSTLHMFFITLILHMFSHASWGHILGNMMFGIPPMLYVEHKLGKKGLSQMYLFSGLAAVALQALTPFGFLRGCIGASGALFGCLGASCYLLSKHKKLWLMGYLLLVLWLVPQLMALASGDSEVAYGAHIGGCLFGVLLAERLTRKP